MPAPAGADVLRPRDPVGLLGAPMTSVRLPTWTRGRPTEEGETTVKMRVLGRTRIRVSPYCLGTMMFGPVGNPDQDACVRIIHRALEAGINFIDTADVTDRAASPSGSSAGLLDVSYAPPAIERPALRRRPASERAAA